ADLVHAVVLERVRPERPVRGTVDKKRRAVDLPVLQLLKLVVLGDVDDLDQLDHVPLIPAGEERQPEHVQPLRRTRRAIEQVRRRPVQPTLDPLPLVLRRLLGRGPATPPGTRQDQQTTGPSRASAAARRAYRRAPCTSLRPWSGSSGTPPQRTRRSAA